MNRQLTIAVFDSGFGGLTVLRALLALIPHANYLYLGDTARLPYGAKSRQTVVRYALSSASFLLAQGADLLVVACNTASALALQNLRAALPIPVLGVIDPGVQAAATAGTPSFPVSPERVGYRAEGSTAFVRTPTVLILATAATVQSAAYTQACAAHGLIAYEKACPLLVPLVEEGWIDHHVTAEVLKIYLTEAFAEAPTATTLILGCTHYPLLKPLIERTLLTLNHPLHIIDSATATAHATLNLLGAPSQTAPSSEVGSCTFYATDSIEKFQRLGSAFLGQPLPQVHLIDLGG